jgi:hypothetical protein
VPPKLAAQRFQNKNVYHVVNLDVSLIREHAHVERMRVVNNPKVNFSVHVPSYGPIRMIGEIARYPRKRMPSRNGVFIR